MINTYNGVSFFCFGHLISLACRERGKVPWYVRGSTGKRELAIVQLSWVSFSGRFADGENNRISFEMIFPWSILKVTLTIDGFLIVLLHQLCPMVPDSSGCVLSPETMRKAESSISLRTLLKSTTTRKLWSSLRQSVDLDRYQLTFSYYRRTLCNAASCACKRAPGPSTPQTRSMFLLQHMNQSLSTLICMVCCV